MVKLCSVQQCFQRYGKSIFFQEFVKTKHETHYVSSYIKSWNFKFLHFKIYPLPFSIFNNGIRNVVKGKKNPAPQNMLVIVSFILQEMKRRNALIAHAMEFLESGHFQLLGAKHFTNKQEVRPVV